MSGAHRIDATGVAPPGVEDEVGVVVDAHSTPVHKVVLASAGHHLDRQKLGVVRVFHTSSRCGNYRAFAAPAGVEALAERPVPQRRHFPINHLSRPPDASRAITYLSVSVKSRRAVHVADIASGCRKRTTGTHVHHEFARCSLRNNDKWQLLQPQVYGSFTHCRPCVRSARENSYASQQWSARAPGGAGRDTQRVGRSYAGANASD